ncbi:MAG: hypothetical protein LAQ30_22005 [Acidobacteriia bacterium]|nr:hypothetical protein [Terriglobia bacterium]
MGANKAQAQAIALFFIAFTLIAVGLAADVSLIALVLGLALLAISIVRFLQCKPWESLEE